MSATEIGEMAALDAAFGDDHGSQYPSSWYVAFFLDDPGESGVGTEVSGPGYARAEVGNDDGNWSGPGGGVKSNLAQITFPEATGGWGEITHWALFDDPVAGDA